MTEPTEPDPMAEPGYTLTPESTEAIAATVIEQETIPPKIPDFDDIEGQTKAVGGALSSALLTATDTPVHALQSVVGDLAHQLVALGIRQTDCIDPEALHAPAWVTDGMAQQSVKIPAQQVHTVADPASERVATAPEPPKGKSKMSKAVPL